MGKFGKSLIALVLATALCLTPLGCAVPVRATDLMQGVKAGSVPDRELDDGFFQAQMGFSLALFQAAWEAQEETLLLSPLSLQLALAMTANGAQGETRDQMVTLLTGDGDLTALNESLHTYMGSLPSGPEASLQIANAIWFREDENRLQVEPAFLQTNGDYYGAGLYQAPFDQQTCQEINAWVRRHTGGRIDPLLTEIDPNHMLYLINALAFDARWAAVYEQEDLGHGTFHSLAGEAQPAEMMHSTEHWFLTAENATGFCKDYAGGSYRFAALLPAEGISLGDYIRSLTPQGLLETLAHPQQKYVQAALPKFQGECQLELSDLLSEMGMPLAFGGGDFSAMGHSPEGPLIIDTVVHKTFLSVDELGTKAGAATQVTMVPESAPVVETSVVLDRPFVYLILDGATNLPIFMGAVTSL